VYVRFGTKSALLTRCIDVALAGDTAPVAVADRDWARQTMTAPTLDERIAVAARGIAAMMARVGPLLAVAAEAAPSEPVIAAAAQAGREGARSEQRQFWAKAAADGLLPHGVDLAWLTDTAALLGAADTYLLATRILDWNRETHEQWLIQTMHRLVAAAALPGRG
jgi:hypothetical protein